jgi:pimeloyl-ACP methyl ester carboxylesterase
MLTLLLGAMVSLAAVSGWLFLQQPAMLFHAAHALDANPTDWGMRYEGVRLTTADGLALQGWYIPRDGAQRVVLFLHGNDGNISHRGESIAIFQRLGLDVFIFDYRGYGRSEGRPDEQGLYRDAQAAWRYLAESRGVAPRQVVLRPLAGRCRGCASGRAGAGQ